MMLSEERIAQLRLTREKLSLQLDELKASPKVQRYVGNNSKRGGRPDSWSQAVQGLEDTITVIDKALSRVIAANSGVGLVASGSKLVDGSDVLAVLASMPRTLKTETRITVRQEAGRKYIDVRVWRLNEGKDIPTLKGVRFAATQLDSVIAALELSKGHV